MNAHLNSFHMISRRTGNSNTPHNATMLPREAICLANRAVNCLPIMQAQFASFCIFFSGPQIFFKTANIA